MISHSEGLIYGMDLDIHICTTQVDCPKNISSYSYIASAAAVGNGSSILNLSKDGYLFVDRQLVESSHCDYDSLDDGGGALVVVSFAGQAAVLPSSLF